MTPEIETQIKAYLANETKLYEDWYISITKTEDTQYTKEVKLMPNVSALQEMYEGWIKQELPSLKEKVCPPYCQKRLEYQEQETWLIAAMADILTVSFTRVPINSVAVAVILVTTKRLDQFCQCSK